MIAGAKATVGTALAAILISVFIGVPVGLVSGFFGGRLDRMIMRIVDAVMAFPDYIVAIVLSGLLGPGLMNLILAVVAVKWVGYARLVRSTVFSENKDYIALAELTGLGSGAILKSTCCPMFSATFPYLRHLISENGVNDCCPVLYRTGCSASIPGMGRHAE